MNIDFPPPSNGVYNNAGSSRQLANYLEHEGMERMEQGIYTEGFFNLNEDNFYKSQVIKDIDGNIGQLLKTDAKFYAIHVSPSEQELRAMGNTEREQAEAMKRYIREIFIPEYAKNFNKGLSTEDIKFYGKIHFSRDRSENELNLHCHLIISRKDQSNKVKISPLTNHRNTKKGVIKGGFDRTALFENVEKGFDKLFDYHRQLSETFEYCNTMRNGSITEQLKMQEKELRQEQQDNNSHERENKQDNIQNPKFVNKFKNFQENNLSNSIENNRSVNQENKQSFNLPDLGLTSALGIFTPEINPDESQQPTILKKKKPKRGLRR